MSWLFSQALVAEYSAATSSAQAEANTGDEHGKWILPCRTDSPIRDRLLKRSPGSHSDGNGWWSSEPGMGRVANGEDRLKAIGNGQVPVVAASAFEALRIS